MRHLLDTDTCIEVIRRREPAASRVRQKSPDDLVVSAMTVAELRFGALNSSDPERTLAGVEALLSAPIEVVSFDENAARQHAEVRLALRAQPIGERDLVIAATARAGGFTVVTRNRRHFERVPGLSVEDWTAA
jgi:tRNA(fMet)-specific endonuclease VapC